MKISVHISFHISYDEKNIYLFTNWYELKLKIFFILNFLKSVYIVDRKRF